MRKKELRSHQRVECAELVPDSDLRKGDAAFAVRGRRNGRLRRLGKQRRKRF